MADTAAAPFPNSNISSLHNRIALITGGSSGIGRHIAVAYAAAGAYIVIADLTPNPPKVPLLEQTSAARHTDHHTPILEILNTKWPVPSDSKHKDRAAFVKCDVTVPEDVEAAVAFAVSTFGRLDIYVNNAGVGLETSVTPVKPLHETDVGLFDKTMAINVRGVWLGMKYAIGQMMRQEVLGGEDGTGDRGWIINMSSVYGLVGSSHVSSYAGSKGAVTLMTRAAAVEVSSFPYYLSFLLSSYERYVDSV